MNRYLKLALPIALICTLLPASMLALFGLVLSINALDPTAQLPFFYVQKLNFPVLSVLLPAVGMVALLPIALRMAFAKETVEAAAPIATSTQANEPSIETHYLKAA
jgi:hypothetical protein